MMNVLFLAANPTQTSPLRLAAEQRAISAKIESSRERANLRLYSVFAARPGDLLSEMNRIRPQIVHFSGHGVASGGLVFESEQGEPKIVSPAALKAVFKVFRPDLQVVVLNACYSSIQVDAFVEIVDAVIAMKDTIGDEAAIVFATGFYRALGFGCSISVAFEQAVASLLLEGIDESHVPELIHLPSRDPATLTIQSSKTLALSKDPKVPEKLRLLLASGARLITISEVNEKERNILFFELILRQSETSYVVQVSEKAIVELVADELAESILSEAMRHQYDWSLVRTNDVRLPSHHTLEMAGVKSGERLMLLGNHKRPEWAPSPPSRSGGW